MDKMIIIAAEARVACPSCSHEFALDQGITRQTIDRYQSDFERTFAERRRELETSLAQEAERKAVAQFSGQLEQLQEQLSTANAAAQEAKAAITKAREEAKAQALEEAATERTAMTQELAEKNLKLKEFQAQELELRKKAREVEEREARLELEFQRKLDEERQRISQQATQRESERFALIEAEYKKKIEDAQRANDDLRRKLEQGSQQLQGEVLELEVEHVLASTFHHDLIEEVKKGQRGADVMQTVRTPTGQVCGRIIWEAKRAEHWNDKWLQKLKDDQQEAGAEFAVLVTTAMPRGISEIFTRIGDVWVVAPHVLRPVADTLRMALLEMHRLKIVNSGRSEKMEQLYNYVSGTGFAQRVRAMLVSLESMRSDLEAEKRAMQRIWTKRQSQIERSTTNVVSIVGELQAISHDQFSELEAIEQIALPSQNE